jgi:hypothetical protein
MVFYLISACLQDFTTTHPYHTSHTPQCWVIIAQWSHQALKASVTLFMHFSLPRMHPSTTLPLTHPFK